MYAIIATGGKQFKVSEGDIITIEKLDVPVGGPVVFDQVLGICNRKLRVGNPYVKKASVEGTVLEQGRGKKVVVYKFKRKEGYHKKQGHRQCYTKVRVDAINTGS